MKPEFHATTVLAILRNGSLCFGADGQVTLGDQIIKANARKIRRLSNDSVIGGFAGHTADAFTLFDRFESRLEDASGNLKKAAVDLAKDWRMDRILRRLEAMLLVGDLKQILLISGQGDVLEPDEPIVAIGSGGQSALSAAKALFHHTNLPASEIVRTSLQIASQHCIYTNSNIVIEELNP